MQLLSPASAAVYGVDGRMDYCFVPSVKSILASLAKINDERLAFWPDSIEAETHTSISRVSASLQLFHHYVSLKNAYMSGITPLRRPLTP